MTRRMKSKQKLKKRSGSRFIVVRPSSASVMNLPPINVREDKIMQEALGYSDLATLLVI